MAKEQRFTAEIAELAEISRCVSSQRLAVSFQLKADYLSACLPRSIGHNCFRGFQGENPPDYPVATGGKK
ncbi:MAG: hypothetical protein LR006_02110 [Dehalococcoidia bacterium]|nr:hypothetical protein [Dehalococcoidia bacterium]MCL0038699.1 hypothetical protein [Dehalococcoidia bacterium]MCL0103047.1 hypothetical protein [Dehalococcoidia bacterium]